MEKILDDVFLKTLPEDTIEACRAVVERYQEWRKKHVDYYHLQEESYQGLLDFLGFLKSFIEIHQLMIDVPNPTLNKEQDFRALRRIIDKLYMRS